MSVRLFFCRCRIRTNFQTIFGGDRRKYHDSYYIQYPASSTLKYKNASSSSSALSYLLPNPQPDPPERQKSEAELRKKEGRTRKPLVQAIKLTWIDYKQTWEGFFDNHGKIDDPSSSKEGGKSDEKDKEVNNHIKNKFLDNINEEKIIEGQKDIQKNFKRNIKVIKNEGAEVVEAMKDITGISNKEELTKWVMVQLRLANQCVGEFMKGYRASRDEEIDKMINVYFNDFEEDDGIVDNKNFVKMIGKEDKIESSQHGEIKPGRRKRRRKSKW